MRLTLIISGILIIGVCLASCGTSAEVPTPTAVPPVAQEPTETQIPADTPTPIPEPTIAPIVITSVEDMIGKWYKTVQGEETYFMVFDDGKAKIRNDWTDIWFEDNLLHIQDSGQFLDCPPEIIGTYEVTSVPGDYIKFTVIEDECVTDRYLRGNWSVNPGQ
jgi:hypothetical protein